MAKYDDKIVAFTDKKVIIKWDRLGEALTKEEKIVMNKLLGKVMDYQDE